jgi:hypothetical protein
LHDATIDPEVIRWFQDHPTANIGLATSVSFDVIDLDDEAAIAALEETKGGSCNGRKGLSLSRLEPSARSDSGQIRGGFSEQAHGRAGYLEVADGCGDRCRGRPDDSDHGGPAGGLDYLDCECVGTVDGAGGQDG